jgi:hypothetical protein
MNTRDKNSPGVAETDTQRGELDSLLQAPVSQHRPIVTAAADRSAVADAAAPASVVTAAPPQVIEADVDGKRVRIVARDEIVLECGDASITLRRNGRIIIKGTYIETSSEGTNRIKGGQVRIN